MRVNKILAIGINEYKDPKLVKLANCVNDISAITAALNDRYRFEETRVLSTPDETTRENIYRILTETLLLATENENILILYAGHGQFHPKLDQVFWQPSDAKQHDPSSWLNLSEVSNFIKKSKAHHICIVADSCYSGGLLDLKRGGGVQPYDEKRSREALTSGGVETVSDGAAGELSPFSKVVIDVLNENLAEQLTFRSFASTVCERFDKDRKQTPLTGCLEGDEHGTFVFEHKATDLEKQMRNETYVKRVMAKLFIPIPDDVMKMIEALKEMKREKNRIVKLQKYEEAASIRNNEKKLEKTANEAMEKLVNEIASLAIARHDFKEEEVNQQKELIALNLRYSDEVTRIQAKVKELSEKREIEPGKEISSPLVQQLIEFFPENPTHKFFLSKQPELLSHYERGIVSLFEYIIILKGKLGNESFDEIISDLSKILLQILQFEMELLRGGVDGFLKENITLKTIELNVLRFLNGDFGYASKFISRTTSFGYAA